MESFMEGDKKGGVQGRVLEAKKKGGHGGCTGKDPFVGRKKGRVKYPFRSQGGGLTFAARAIANSRKKRGGIP